MTPPPKRKKGKTERPSVQYHRKLDALVERLKHVMDDFEEMSSDAEDVPGLDEDLASWVGETYGAIVDQVESYQWLNP